MTRKKFYFYYYYMSITGLSTVEYDELFLYNQTPNKLLELSSDNEVVSSNASLDDYYTKTQVDDKLLLKANLESPTFTGIVSGITKAMVGLSNVDNTTDIAKPISTLTQDALNLKANITYVNEEIANAINQRAPSENPSFTGQTLFSSGTATVPSISFTGNTNTGFYRITINTLGFTTNGVERMRITDTGITSTGVLQLPLGTTNVPALNFGSSNTGFFGQPNVIGIATGGSQRFRIDNTSTLIRSLRNLTNTGGLLQYNATTFEVTYNRDVDLNNINVTGTISGITKAMVGLGNVDNTSDLAKPISTLTQTALDLKANLASPTFTGTVSGITKAMVGLSNVDNTTDLAKPISTLTQTALDLKANLASPTFTGTVSGITKAMVGLSNVDNTTDLGKPISTLTQTAINTKANLNYDSYRNIIRNYPLVWQNVTQQAITNPQILINTTINAINSSDGNWASIYYLPAADSTIPNGQPFYFRHNAGLTSTINTARTNLTSNYTLTGGYQNLIVIFVYNANLSLYEFYGEIKINSIPTSNEFNSRGNSYVLPSVRGSANNVLVTNGAGTTSWETNLTLGSLTVAGVTSSGNMSIISPSGDSEIKIRTQNNLNSRLVLREFTDSYGCDFSYNGATNLISIDAWNVSKTTIFTTDITTYVSTFFRQVNFENNMTFPNNTSVLSMCGLSQPTNGVINPQFTFLHPTTKVNQKTGISYIDIGGAPGMVCVANGAGILQIGDITGVTALTQIRGKKDLTSPAYSFTGDTDTGLTSDAADSITIRCGGITTASFNTGEVNLIGNNIYLQTSYLNFGTSGQLFLTYNQVSGSGYDAINFYCQSKLRFQIVDNTSNIQECRFYGVTAQGNSYLSIFYWSDAHIYYRNSRQANDPTPKRHYFQAYDYQGLKTSFITPGITSWQTTFTGQHICAFEMAQINVGYIVVSTGKISSFIDNNDGHLETKMGKDGVMIDEALPIVTYSSKMNQKSVFGVVCSVEAEDAETRDMGFDVMTSYSKEKRDRRVIVNSIGEGAVWVCNSNGNLENGDYITSSTVTGIGCKQDDDLLHNYTVAKITIDCNFTDSTAYDMKYVDFMGQDITEDAYYYKKSLGYNQIYICAFVPCTYHCG